MTPEEKYPEVCSRLQIWADYNRGGINLPGVNEEGYSKTSMLAKIKKMKENAGERTLFVEQIVYPIIVDEMEEAIVKLPDKRWTKLIGYQWIRGWSQRCIARRMSVSQPTLWAWRIHAYGVLKDRLYGVSH